MDPQPIANRFTPLRSLGEGAMGAVLLVQDGVTGEQVALKVISQALGLAEKTLLQFKQEFRQMTQLHHPNCCRVYDYGQTPDGAPYFTMEVVPGHGLDELLPLDEASFRKVFAQLLLALGYVHQQGFVHLDIKGANVRVTPAPEGPNPALHAGPPARMGTVKLMDFGLMERAGQPLPAVRGTVPYLAPEVVKRAPIDGRTDLYSVGALAYELLTGRPPFVGESPMAVVRAHVTERPEPPSRYKPGLAPDLERIVLRMLAKEPLERFATAYDVLEQLGYEPPPGLGGSLLGPPMVGREAELERLRAGLQAVAAGRPAEPCWISGGAGLGKSRLLDEFRCLAQLENVPYVRGASHEHGDAPYAPVVAILRGLLPLVASHVPEALAAAAPVLGALLPELGAPPAPPMDSPKSEMMRLHGAVAGLLGALSAVQPFVLVLENWRGADASSRELLAYLLRARADAPFFVVTTTRRGADAGGAPDGPAPLSLAPLGPPALARMVQAMLGCDQVAPGFLAGLEALTGGNPLAVERALDLLVRRRVLVGRHGTWNTDVALDAGLAEELQALLVNPLDGLPAAALQVAQALAVLGRPERLEALQALTLLEDDALLAAVDALAAAQLLARDDEGLLRFTRQDLQGRVYAELPAGDRQGLHTRAADRLERELGARAAADAPPELVAALARHALHGPRGERAIRYALEAGRRAVALFALPGAEELLEEGLAVLEAEGAADRPQTQLDYLALLGEARRHQGKTEAAAADLARAVALAEQLGERARAGRLWTTLARCHQVLARYDEALACCERSLAACLEAGDQAGAARCLLTRSRIQFFQGQSAAARASAETALVQAEAGGEANILGFTCALLGYLVVATEPTRATEGVALLERSLALQEAAGDRVGLNDSLNLLGNAETSLGNVAAARAAFARSRDVCRAAGLVRDEIVALVNLALAALELGSFAEARALAVEAEALATTHGAKLPRGIAIASEAQAAACLGDVAGAEAHARQAVELGREMGNKYLEGLALLHLLEVLLVLGQLEQAGTAATEARALLQGSENREAEQRLALLAGELAVRTRDLAAAERGLAGVLAEARGSGARGLELRALVAQARLALAKEAFDDARTQARAAAALAGELGAAYHQAEALGLLGEACLAGGLEPAATHFEAMLALAEATGAPVPRALALFGLAAAASYGPEAAPRAAEARELLEATAAALPEHARTAFLAYPERQRVLGGNFVGFGLAVRRAPRPGTGPLGLRFGGTGGL